MKVSKEQLQKIIKEELSSMQQEGEVDEALGTFLKSLGTGVSGAISAAKEASKKADMEAEKAKQEAKLAAEKVKTSSDVEAIIKTALKQVTGTLESLNTLVLKMKDLGMPLSETGLDLPMVLQQLKTARTALFHGGRKTQPLSKDQGIAGFETGNKFQSAARTERPAQRSKMEEQEQE